NRRGLLNCVEMRKNHLRIRPHGTPISNTVRVDKALYFRNMFVLLIVNGNISFGIGIVSLFEFRWAVDQDGYEIERIAAREGSSLVDTEYEHEVIRPRGGPLRGYRPMDDYPDLWRRFTAC